MKRLLFTLLAMCLTMVAYAQATSLTVDCQTPGWLSSKINYGDQVSVQNLIVIGYLNADDMAFINSLSTNHNLRHLDISEVYIVGKTTDTDNVFDFNWLTSAGKKNIYIRCSSKKNDRGKHRLDSKG